MGWKGGRAGWEARGEKTGLNPVEQSELADVRGREGCGMGGVAVKCIDITQRADCEGRIPGPD